MAVNVFTFGLQSFLRIFFSDIRDYTGQQPKRQHRTVGEEGIAVVGGGVQHCSARAVEGLTSVAQAHEDSSLHSNSS